MQTAHTMNDPVLSMLQEINKKLERISRPDDDLWDVNDIADYLKLSKSSIFNRVFKDKTFPENIVLVTGSRRWVAKEVKAWATRR